MDNAVSDDDGFNGDAPALDEVDALDVVVVSANTPLKSGWAETRDAHRFRFRRTDGGGAEVAEAAAIGWELVRDVRTDDVAPVTKAKVR